LFLFLCICANALSRQPTSEHMRCVEPAVAACRTSCASSY
jgi:hypothetical protein